MDCPRCQNELELIKIEENNIAVCKKCQGMWLHKSQLNNLLKEIEGDIEMCSIDDNLHLDEEPLIKCLECDNIEMRKTNLLEFSDVIFDYCPGCGAYWLDKGELDKMHIYLGEIKEKSRDVKEPVAHHLLVKLSETIYSVFSG